MKNNLILISTVVMMSGLLSACASHKEIGPSVASDTQQTTVPVVSKPSAAETDAIKQLKTYNARVQMVGDYVKVVIPGDALFQNDRSQLTDQASAILNQVVNLVKNQPKESMHINVYTFPQGSKVIEKAVTQRQADAVQRYLWRHGANARFISAVGKGATDPVSYEQENQSLNYRVEIMLQEYKSAPKVNLINY